MMSIAKPKGLVVGSMVALVLGLFPLQVRSQDFVKSVPVAEKARVEISLKSGDLEVSAWDKNEIRVTGDEEVPVDVEEDGKLVRIGTEGISGSQDIHVNLPGRVDLTIRTISGDVRMEGVSGRTRIQTVSGDLNIKQCQGAVDVKTVSGDLTISRIDAGFESKTVSGNVVADEISGALIEAKTVSGDIRLRGAIASQFRLSSHSGDIWVVGSTPKDGSIQANSFSGDLDITLPNTLGFDLLAKSRSGDVKAEMPVNNLSQTSHSIEGRVGEGESNVTLSTFSGEIRIRVQP